MAESAALASVFRQPFAEQVAFFRAKLNLPTERWDDIWQAAHDRAFIVAGAAKADLLADLRAAVDKGIHDGTTLAEFRRDFRAIVARHGWTGWTGEGTKAGVAWRTRTIFETNLRTSYAAGRYRQLTDPELLALRPFWRYVHSDLVKTPRPHHKGWGDSGLTLRHDHPFWQTHFPPNGWGCRCTVTAVREPGKGDATDPPEGWDAVVEKTGAPPGIDRGWAYAPGARADEALRTFVQEKLIRYPLAITRALSHDVNQYINAIDAAQQFVADVLADKSRTEPLWLGFVEHPERFVGLVSRPLTGYTVLVPAGTVRHVHRNHQFDGRGQRPAEPGDYARLMRGLDEGRLSRGENGPEGQDRIVVLWSEEGETFRAVYEVRAGRRNRALVLYSLVVKTE